MSHRAGEPLPPPDGWWTDDPVERMRRAVPVIVGPDSRARVGEAEMAAIAGPKRGDRATWTGAMRQEAALAGHDLPGRLAAVRAPTLMVHGDGLVDLERGRALADGIDGARLLVLPGVGHLPWVERPAEATGAIAGFLAAASERAAASPRAGERHEEGRAAWRTSVTASNARSGTCLPAYTVSGSGKELRRGWEPPDGHGCHRPSGGDPRSECLRKPRTGESLSRSRVHRLPFPMGRRPGIRGSCSAVAG